MSEPLEQLFQDAYRGLRPQSEIPALTVEYFSFTRLNNTIRLRDGRLRVRISDLLEGAPETVLRAIAHILLAKLYRQPVAPGEAARWRRYLSSRHVHRQMHHVRQLRGRKRLGSPRGHFYDLEAIFEDLNQRFFHGLMARPRLSWSQVRARSRLGHYDSSHNAIVISRVFDHPQVPRCAVEYIVYHEMLHLKHPVKLKGSRRCVHSGEFRAEEKLFPRLEEAKRFLKRI